MRKPTLKTLHGGKNRAALREAHKESDYADSSPVWKTQPPILTLAHWNKPPGLVVFCEGTAPPMTAHLPSTSHARGLLEAAHSLRQSFFVAKSIQIRHTQCPHRPAESKYAGVRNWRRQTSALKKHITRHHPHTFLQSPVSASTDLAKV